MLSGTLEQERISDDLRLPSKVLVVLIPAVVAFASVANVSFIKSFTSTHLFVVLLQLIAIYALICPRFLFCREIFLYAMLFSYMSLSLFWAPNLSVAMNTQTPGANVLLIFLLIGSLTTFQSLRLVATGLVSGFVLGVVVSTLAYGFPFVSSDIFSYNAIASLYLSGLFAVLVYGWVTRTRLFPLSAAIVVLLHIAGTTSIKTNLGIGLGLATVSIIYFGQTLRIFWRNAIFLLLAVGVFAFAVQSNEEVMERIEAGVARVSVGVAILQARDDRLGYGGFSERKRWMNQGLAGWVQNPIFGRGAEAFRADFGITSHSTPIDLLYNFGVIGVFLFYSIFASIAWRVLRVVGPDAKSLGALVVAGIVCHIFISFSSTAYYQTFLAIFFAVTTALLRRFGHRSVGDRVSERLARE